MKRLSHRQEQIMAILWATEPLTVQEIQEKMDVYLHYNTISTVVRELEKISFVKHIDRFKPYRYVPCISKRKYLKELIIGIVGIFFNNSITDFLQEIKKMSVSK